MKFLILFLFPLLLLCSCTTTVEKELTEQETMATAQAGITLPTQFAVSNPSKVISSACKVMDVPTIQTQQSQGNLIEWSPISDDLAIVEPSNKQWGWFIGMVEIYGFPLGTKVYASESKTVFGDVTWSPDAQYISYAVLDQAAEVYTIFVDGVRTKSAVDLFNGNPSPVTDEYSSRKAIQSWDTQNNLMVVSSCGGDCIQVYSYDPSTGLMTDKGYTRKKDEVSLIIQNENTSPDGKWQIMVDEDDNVWLTSIKDNKVSLLLSATTINEIKWSSSSNYLALRADDHVMVYEMKCSSK